MHNWRLLLLAFLAVFQPIASFTERNLVDGREQCCDRNSLLRDSRLSYGTDRFNKLSEDRRLNRAEICEDRRNEIRKADAVLTRPSADRRLVEFRFERDVRILSASEPARLIRTEFRRESVADSRRDRFSIVNEDRERRDRNAHRITSRDISRDLLSRVIARVRLSGNVDTRQQDRDNKESVFNRATRNSNRINHERNARSSMELRRETRRSPYSSGEFSRTQEVRETRDVLQRARINVARSEIFKNHKDRRVVNERPEERRAQSDSRLQLDNNREHRFFGRRASERVDDYRRTSLRSSSEGGLRNMRDESRLSFRDTREDRQRLNLRQEIEKSGDHRVQRDSKVSRDRVVSVRELQERSVEDRRKARESIERLQITDNRRTRLDRVDTRRDSRRVDARRDLREISARDESSRVDTRRDTREDDARRDSRQVRARVVLSRVDTRRDTREDDARRVSRQVRSRVELSRVDTRRGTREDSARVELSRLDTQRDTREDDSRRDSRQVRARVELSRVDTRRDTREDDARRESRQVRAQVEWSRVDTRRDTREDDARRDSRKVRARVGLSRLDTRRDTREDNARRDSRQVRARVVLSGVDTRRDTREDDARRDSRRVRARVESSRVDTRRDTREDDARRDSRQVRARVELSRVDIRRDTREDDARRDSRQVRARVELSRVDTRRDTREDDARRDTREDDARRDSRRVYIRKDSRLDERRFQVRDHEDRAISESRRVESRRMDRESSRLRDITLERRDRRTMDLESRHIKRDIQVSRLSDIRDREVSSKRAEYRIAKNVHFRPIDARFRSTTEFYRTRDIFGSVREKNEVNEESSAMNWRYILYTLQGLYICHVLIQMLTQKTSEKKSRVLGWWSAPHNIVKLD